MKDTFRLIGRVMPWYIGFISFLPLAGFSLLAAIYYREFSHSILLNLSFLLGLYLLGRIMSKRMVADEIMERKGKPVEILKPGFKSYTILDEYAWYYKPANGKYPIIVNPKPGKFTLIKHFHIVDALDYKSFDEQMLEIAAKNEEAAKCLHRKIDRDLFLSKCHVEFTKEALKASEPVMELLK